MQLVLGRAVAAVGVRVAALEQLSVARTDLGLAGRIVQVEVSQGVALEPAQPPVRLAGLLGSAPGGAEDAERVGEPAPGAGCEGRGFARELGGAELPGRLIAGDRLGPPALDLGLAHAGEEVPG